MKISINGATSNYKDLKTFIKKSLVANSLKLKGKFAPISEKLHDSSKSLQVKKIYNLIDINQNLYLLIFKNHSKHPKERYFLAISLAAQSSDFLVLLATEFAHQNDIKLIQYSIIPKSKRISLLSLKEIENRDDISVYIKLLETFRKEFRSTLIDYIK